MVISSLSQKLGCETVLARGATLENVSVYSCYSVKYWCGGAALLAKLWSCGRDCAGFGKCAAGAGCTLGLDVWQGGGFNFVPVGFTLMGAYFNFLDTLNCFAVTSFNLVDALIYFTGVSFSFMDALNYLADAPF